LALLWLLILVCWLIQTGPIRPFTPYHRKRKSQTGDSHKAKLEKLQSKESNTDDSDGNTPGTPISAVLNPLTQALLKLNASPPSSTEEGWKFLEEVRILFPILNSHCFEQFSCNMPIMLLKSCFLVSAGGEVNFCSRCDEIADTRYEVEN